MSSVIKDLSLGRKAVKRGISMHLHRNRAVEVCFLSFETPWSLCTVELYPPEPADELK